VVRRDGSKRSPRKPKTRGQSLFPVVVEFRRGSSAPRLQCVNLLYRCGEWLAERRGERVTVVGHANNRGSDKAATALARARVAVVVKLLLLLGARHEQVVPLATPRVHTVRFGSSLKERRQRRVVVVFRHEPLQEVQGVQRRPKPGGRRRLAVAVAL
jgi:outer membrane protein OmpA-like peptidoglycan-associated protein